MASKQKSGRKKGLKKSERTSASAKSTNQKKSVVTKIQQGKSQAKVLQPKATKNQEVSQAKSKDGNCKKPGTLAKTKKKPSSVNKSRKTKTRKGNKSKRIKKLKGNVFKNLQNLRNEHLFRMLSLT